MLYMLYHREYITSTFLLDIRVHLILNMPPTTYFRIALYAFVSYHLIWFWFHLQYSPLPCHRVYKYLGRSLISHIRYLHYLNVDFPILNYEFTSFFPVMTVCTSHKNLLLPAGYTLKERSTAECLLTFTGIPIPRQKRFQVHYGSTIQKKYHSHWFLLQVFGKNIDLNNLPLIKIGILGNSIFHPQIFQATNRWTKIGQIKNTDSSNRRINHNMIWLPRWDKDTTN